MAIMDPEDIQNYKHTKSEAFFYDRLKEQLSDKYHCFFSVRWYDEVDGKRVDSECDFLVFDPGFGFLTIEVKGGNSIDIDDHGVWTLTEHDQEGNTSDRKLKESPFSQAEKSMRYFKDSFAEEYLQTFKGAYGFAVCFPFYAVTEKIENAANSNLIIDMRHMDSLHHRINEIFHYWKNRNNVYSPFSAEQKKRFISMVHKQISLSAAAGALIPLKEKELQKINLVQDSIIDFLSNYKQVQIIGGAGTGKTYMAIKKLRKEYYADRKLLYICKNTVLAEFVKKELDISGILCIDYTGLIKMATGKEPLDGESIFDLVSGSAHERYDAIVVDEAQDFTLDEALTVRLFLKDDSKSDLYVFLDENQNLFNVNYDSAFAIDTPPYILRYNIRNTGEIYKYATHNTGLGTETRANSLLGVIPDVRKCKNRIQVVSTVSSILNRLIQKEYVKTDSIVILSDVKYSESALSGETSLGAYKINYGNGDEAANSIRFWTVSEYKGLESDVVIYLKSAGHDDVDDRYNREEDYVAYTRARYYLYIIEQR